MTAMPTQMDVLRFPLSGSRLIEASAGTGKTYTIAALYVRLVLGHQSTRAFTPPEILVVTFTDAATQELRDRIRVRLAKASAFFLDTQAEGDEFLQRLRDDYSSEDWPACARKLQLAAEWMDEAAVSTIHAWCHRMLREHAFDSDSLFTQTLETDQSELLAEVVRDYWRSFMYPLAVPEVKQLMLWWASPDALQADLRRLLEHTALLGDAVEPAVALKVAAEEKLRRLAELKAPWAHWVEELQSLLDGARDEKRFNGTKLKKNNYDGWLKTLNDWQADPEMEQLALSEAAWIRLSPAGLGEVWKADFPKPQHPALAALEVLRSALAELPDAREELLRHAAHWVAARFAMEQASRAQMGFAELLIRLDAALSGANGVRLANRISGQFPVAMIDEFQDTDALQYRIFDTVYHVEAHDAQTALILIGDPKQAIYAFRGADIYTYLAARDATAGRHYTLKRNFRSTHAMVAATNRCFELAEERQAGLGAFHFRKEGKNPVPFFPADAAGRRDALHVGNQEHPALTVWSLPATGDTLGKSAYLEQMAAVCASEMVRLLDLGQQGLAGLVADGRMRPLRPADMAVLVNNGNEAKSIRAALSARALRSVYLSEKESVFGRPQAQEMQFWLTACAQPDDPGALRAALATPTLNLDFALLDRLNRDELAWEARVLQFRDYRACWRRQGVLPMLRRLLHDFEVPARLLGQSPQGGDGERVLTDVLHLAELLQQASTLLEGEHALIRHLAEQCREADGGEGAGGDARQIRLESDADLVQVVTVHKSKGLEYPLVFLPFACTFRVSKVEDLPLKWHDESGGLHLSLKADATLLSLADQDRLAEDLRKLYVALTRARYATWVGAAPLESLERSAFGYLLGGGQPLSSGLEALAAGCEQIALIPEPKATYAPFLALEPGARLGNARTPSRSLREHWWIASYSALHLDSHAAEFGKRIGADTPQEAVFLESAQSGVVAVHAAAADASGRLHAFPRGAEVGSFLHALLEWAAAQGFGRLVREPGLLRDAVARRCKPRGWSHWIAPLSAWLTHFLGMRLPGFDVALAELETYVAEMAFWLAVHRVDIEQLDVLVCHHTLAGRARPALQAGQLNGMLKGYIDLVVEHEGRYFVVDYKSNHLGTEDGDYDADTMGRAILDQRYELQYVLYLLALHRLLKLRLPDYDYERHVGGAIYLFLRGSHAPSQGVYADRPPRELIEALDALFIEPQS